MKKGLVLKGCFHLHQHSMKRIESVKWSKEESIIPDLLIVNIYRFVVI